MQSAPSYTGVDLKKLEQVQWRCARFLQLITERGQKQPDIVKQTAVTLTLQATVLSAVLLTYGSITCVLLFTKGLIN